MKASLALPALLLAVPVAAQAPDGAGLFARTCAPCHGRGPGNDGSVLLPGTAALQAKYKGELPAAIEQRNDLTPEVLRYIVRHGQGAMPMFRKTEITDGEIDAIGRYLQERKPAPNRR